MSNSFTFTIFDKDTGLPRTGLTVKMRYSKDAFATDAFTCAEVDAENSPGEYRMTNYVTAKYKTWVNGSEDDSFGGPNGKPLISEEDLILLDALSAYWDFKNKRAANINDPVNDKDGVNKQWSVSQYYSKTAMDSALAAKVGTTGDHIISGKLGFYQLPKLLPDPDIEPGTYAVPSNLGDMIYLKYFNYRLSLLNSSPTPQSFQHIRVYKGATIIVGKLYPSILQAVNYCVNATPAPGANHVYVITVENMGTGSTMAADSGSIRDYINIIAVGEMIEIIVGDDTLSSNSAIANATLYFGAGVITSAREYTDLKLYNNRVYNYKDLKFTDGILKDCTFISQSGYKIILDGDVQVENCIFSEEPDVAGHTGARIYDVATGVYTVPTDPTEGT